MASKVKYDSIVSFKTLLDFCCEKYGNKGFFKKIGENGLFDITYNIFREDCCTFAAGLTEKGFDGEHIAMISENSYEYYVIYFGTVMSGNIFIPINQDMEADKRNELISFADTETVILSKKYFGMKENISENCLSVKRFLTVEAVSDSILSYEKIMKETDSEAAMKAQFKDSIYNDAVSMLVFTSGTTDGKQKIVMLSAKNILACARGGANEALPDDSEFQLIPLPCYHLAALNYVIYYSMLRGDQIAVSSSVKDVFRDFRIYKPTGIIIVPALGEAVLKLLEAEVDRLDKRDEFEKYTKKADADNIPFTARRDYCRQFKGSIGGNITLITFCGAKTPARLKIALRRFAIRVQDGYGMTECAPMVAAEYNELRPESVGQIYPYNEVRIVDNTAYVKGDNVMLGYYKNPEATKAAVNEDGWISTGDLAKIDDDGFLYIYGRSKNVIALANGENIDPEEIEAIIKQSEYVKEVLVVPDLKSGNTSVGALVFPDREKAEGEGRDTEKVIEDVIDSVNSCLPISKRVMRFRLTNEPFEKNAMMKTIRIKYQHIDV